MDTNDWTVAEMGIYQRLLLSQWVNGDLPPESSRLARIAGCSQKVFDHSWLTVSQKFTVNSNGRLTNLRMEEVRQEQEEYKQKQIESGRLGGLKTQEKKRKTLSKPSSDPSSQNKALQSSSSTSSLIHKNKKNIIGVIPPKIEDVKNYCSERNNGIDAEQFFDYYESRGWMIGKNKMKDFKAAIRTWERNNKDKPSKPIDTEDYIGQALDRIKGVS
jgi:uncharacterized protein YdaU (DUF1376 family)